jgi:7-keto-8-aminopelargonate synthetase-like enzyme
MQRVHGPAERGLSQRPVSREALAVVHTCGKALASAVDCVWLAGLRNFLINQARTLIFAYRDAGVLAGQIGGTTAGQNGQEREQLS